MACVGCEKIWYLEIHWMMLLFHTSVRGWWAGILKASEGNCRAWTGHLFSRLLPCACRNFRAGQLQVCCLLSRSKDSMPLLRVVSTSHFSISWWRVFTQLAIPSIVFEHLYHLACYRMTAQGSMTLVLDSHYLRLCSILCKSERDITKEEEIRDLMDDNFLSPAVSLKTWDDEQWQKSFRISRATFLEICLYCSLQERHTIWSALETQMVSWAFLCHTFRTLAFS